MKRFTTISAVLFLAIFVFSLALTLSTPVMAETDACCSIRATAGCSQGAGEMYNGKCRCNVFNYPTCQHICPVCW